MSFIELCAGEWRDQKTTSSTSARCGACCLAVAQEQLIHRSFSQRRRLCRTQLATVCTRVRWQASRARWGWMVKEGFLIHQIHTINVTVRFWLSNLDKHSLPVGQRRAAGDGVLIFQPSSQKHSNHLLQASLVDECSRYLLLGPAVERH